MHRPPFDVLIIGAGAAGLAAAAELARAGTSALLLEARDRIGGRVWSRHEPDLPVPIELGAEFIHGRPAVTFSLLESAGIRAVDAPFARFTAHHGHLQPERNDFFGEVQCFLRAHADALQRDVSFESFLARCGGGLSKGARAFARMRVQGYDAADPARISARAVTTDWIRTDVNQGGHFRPQGGYGALMDFLARGIADSSVRLRMKTIVRAVRWKRGSVAIEGASAGRPFRATASRAIVTLPLGVLQISPGVPGAVRFTPPLTEKHAALGGLASGPVVKVALRFRTAFWEDLDDSRYRDAAFFRSPRAAFPTFWTALPMRMPLLIAWAGGPKAARVSAVETSDIVRSAVKSLTSILGKRANIDKQFVSAYCHDWRSDPFARGAYSYTLVGGEKAREMLAMPLRETLFFAGEASADQGEHATVAGALQSGIRAARQLLAVAGGQYVGSIERRRGGWQ